MAINYPGFLINYTMHVINGQMAILKIIIEIKCMTCGLTKKQQISHIMEATINKAFNTIYEQGTLNNEKWKTHQTTKSFSG